MNPTISVVMSVFNGEEYLAEAIDSVLSQTFKDFEFLIIDDGSSDKSHHIISKFAKNDHRIRVITHSHNRGLVYGLNEAVAAAAGKYIARMDADDVALPERLEIQLAYMEAHPQCAVLATRVTVIDELGIQQSDWEEDAENVGGEEIRRYMPVSNCIAHPSVLVRADIMKKYGYRSVPAAEDYDLWLRLLADGHLISKLADRLLKYRYTSGSITQTYNAARGPNKKLQAARRAFLLYRLSRLRFNKFDFRVLQTSCRQAARPFISQLKRVLATPLILRERRRFNGHIYRKEPNDKSRLLFLVPWLTMGGAEKIILELVRGLASEYEIHIIITEKTVPSKWIHRFNDATNIVDLAKAVHYPANKVPYIQKYVKVNRIDILIISNSFDGYRSLPGIKKRSPKTKVVDILHGQGGKIDKGSSPLFSRPYHRLIDKHVTVTEYLRSYMHEQFGLPKNDFVFIPNGVELSSDIKSKKNQLHKELNLAPDVKIVGWLGRFNDEKKPLLGLEITKKTLTIAPKNTVFVFAGDGPQKGQMAEFIKHEKLSSKVFLPGPLEDAERLLIDSYALLMTSEMEGMPLAILEASMAGVPVVASKVGGIPEIVKDGQTGYLINFDRHAADNFALALSKILQNEELRQTLSQGANKLAENFTVDRMVDKYRQLLQSLSG